MKLTYDHLKFYDDTGIVMDLRRAKELCLTTDDISAAYFPHNVNELLHYCSLNPQFHIISCVKGGLYVNHYDEKGFAFFLADGDDDPDLAMDPRPFVSWFLPILLDRTPGGKN